MSKTKIEKSYRILAPRARVFDAWLSNEHCVAPVVRMHADRKPGGTICLYLSNDAGGGTIAGTFLAFRDGERLRYTWQWEGSPEVSSVDVRFADDGAYTIVTLTHNGIDSTDAAEQHSNGWDSYINGLSRSLGSL